MLVSAVGLDHRAAQAEQVLREGDADAIFAGREWLRDPHFALRAAAELGEDIDYWPAQYARAALTRRARPDAAAEPGRTASTVDRRAGCAASTRGVLHLADELLDDVLEEQHRGRLAALRRAPAPGGGRRGA